MSNSSNQQKEEDEDYIDIDEVGSEKKTYLDSRMFEYKGNNYTYNAIAERCDEFLKGYKRFGAHNYHYQDLLNAMLPMQTFTLKIDYNDICNAHVMDEDTYHSNFLHSLLEDNPKLFIKAMRRASFYLLQRYHFDYAKQIKNDFKVVISNATMFRKEITQINHSDVGHLVYTEDFVISVSEQKDFTKRMAWICGECGRITNKDTVSFKLPRLKKCMYCDSEDIIESNKDAITDTMQEVKIQQRFERMESGTVPKTIYGYVFGKDMINLVRAGDVCAITAIVDIQRNPNPAENAVSDYYLEVLWVQKIPDSLLIDDPELEERVKTFIDPENEDEGYQNMVNSIAPSIMGHEIIKEALLLQLVGSDTAWFRDNSRHRGESNILLVGDAGTAKTKLAKYVYRIYTRASYTAGNVTEPGMTAAVDVTHKSGHHVLTAGAYLLASSDSGGIAVCDEMEKTRLEAKSATASCLDDDQMLEIHKGNIHQSIQINCASLHIANPKTGESWNPEISIKENTGFENWYLSRFCTWIVRDIVDKELDTKKAKHYLSQFGDTVRQNELEDSTTTSLNEIRRAEALQVKSPKEIKTVPEMRMYHKYARKNFHPRINPKSKAAKKLEDFYISVRPMTGNTKGLKIGMRNLGDLVRFAEESARAHFRNEVLEKDADIAIQLVSSSIASSGFNMFTGKYETIGEMEEKELAKRKGMAIGENTVGFFTAKELLENKTAREIISQDIERMAHKRQNRFYREVSQKMKKIVKAVKMFSLMKCRDCAGDGHRREGGMVNVCYSCQGHGGYIQPFNIGELNYTLTNVGLSNTDIHELTSHLIKKKIILPKFNDINTYEVTKDYKNALLELTAIETQIDLVMDIEQETVKDKEMLVKDPEMMEKINKLRNMMSPEMREKIRKQLEDVKEK